MEWLFPYFKLSSVDIFAESISALLSFLPVKSDKPLSLLNASYLLNAVS